MGTSHPMATMPHAQHDGGGDVQPDRPRPAPRDEPAEHDVQEERALHDGDDVGKEPVHHDSQSSRESRAYGHRMKVRHAAAFAVLIAYGWWATALPAVHGRGDGARSWGRAQPPMTWSAIHRHVQPRSGVRRPGIMGWIILFGILVAWQGAAYWQRPRSEHPTVSSMTNAVLETRSASARVRSVARHRNAIGSTMARAVTIAGFVVIAITMVGCRWSAPR